MHWILRLKNYYGSALCSERQFMAAFGLTNSVAFYFFNVLINQITLKC